MDSSKKLFRHKKPYDIDGTEKLFIDAMREVVWGGYAAVAAAGVVRITSAGNMSRTVSGEAHDGCYALRKYSRIVETELF